MGRSYGKAGAAVGGGQEGVSLLLNQYAEQLRTAMLYTGCRSLAEISPSVLRLERR
ncbi:MAG: alpha-hydroxy-acid oxidizing protein [Deltaproteobacteria bacterium]|nr:alpha-hydroxy-acid oxidizing protein [Deltaproteobacteria bacterium]